MIFVARSLIEIYLIRNHTTMAKVPYLQRNLPITIDECCI